MSVPIGIGTFAKHLGVFFFAPRRVVKFVCGVKMLVTGQENHGANLHKILNFRRA